MRPNGNAANHDFVRSDSVLSEQDDMYLVAHQTNFQAQRPHTSVPRLPVDIHAMTKESILWYQDILRALLHLHSLGIFHSEVRIDNVLFFSDHRAMLSDFGCCCLIGHPNSELWFSGDPLTLNGRASTISESTDLFAIGSAIYEIEKGTKPQLIVDENGALILPQVSTGNSGMDTMIRNAWLGHYDSAAQMLADAESLQDSTIRDSRRPIEYPVSDGCILHGLSFEEEIREIEEQFGSYEEDQSNFKGYKIPVKGQQPAGSSIKP